MDDYDFDGNSEKVSKKFVGMPAWLLASLILALPFMAVDFFNYYSAGTALVISFPVLCLLYAGCGALAGFFTARKGGDPSTFALTGAFSGLALWLASTVVNTIIALILGTASLGTTLLLGVPYLCLCAPFQLFGGGLLGALGGFLFGLFWRRSGSSSSTGDSIYGE